MFLNGNRFERRLGAIAVFLVVFFIGCWLAGNPFEATVRIDSPFTKSMGWVGTDQWGIIWSVVLLAMFFEFMDASAGMGFGTALTPLLLVIGFSPKQIVPVVMIQQGVAGLVGAVLHKEFENVVWRFKPMSETVKLWLIIAVAGCSGHGLFHYRLLCLSESGQDLDQAVCGRTPLGHGLCIGFADEKRSTI